MSAADAAGWLLAIAGGIGLGFALLGAVGILLAAVCEWWGL